MNKLDKIFLKNSKIKQFTKSYIDYLNSVLNNISLDEVEKFIDILLSARERGSSIFFIGNGGSASTASHFANDLSIGTRMQERPFRTISLCDNQSVITAIGNDYGYENIFSKQLEILLNKDDVVIAISASGNSPNLLKAVDTAKIKKAITVGLTAFDGGKLSQSVNFCVHVPTDLKEYGPAEDGHLVLNHLIANYLTRYLKN